MADDPAKKVREVLRAKFQELRARLEDEVPELREQWPQIIAEVEEETFDGIERRSKRREPEGL